MPLAGAKIRASDIPSLKVYSKGATESVTSSTTVQNDDDIVLSIEAGKSYRIDLVLTVSSGGAEAADIKVAWAWTGTETKQGRSIIGPALAATDSLTTSAELSAFSLTSQVTYGIDADRATAIYEQVLLEDVTVAGTLTLQWAQASSSGTATVLSTSSRAFVAEYVAA
jgi:hypothetical protein